MSAISKVLPDPPNNFSTTLSSNISSSDLTIPLNSTTGLGTEGVGVIFQKDSDGNPVTSTIEFIHWTGKFGNNLTLTDTGDRGLSGSASGAQAHSAGDTFEVWVHSAYYHGGFAGVEHNTDGTHGAVTATSVSTDTINEKTAGSGVTIDSVVLKDGAVTATSVSTDTINEKTAGSGVTIDSVVLKDGGITTSGKAQFNTEAVFDAEYDNGNSGTSKTIDWTNGNKQKLTLTGNVTLTFTAPSGPCNLILKLVQDAIGGRTVTWPSTVKWAGGTAPTLTTTASAIDIISFYWDGVSYYAQSALNFS